MARLWLGAGVGLLVVWLMAAGALAEDDPNTRTDRRLKCRYTLPDERWSWLDTSELNLKELVFSARRDDGTTVAVTAIPNEGSGTDFSDKLVKGFESGYLKSYRGRRRSGQRVTFRGLPAYQLNATLQNEVSASVRLFIANDLAYCVQVLGPEPRIEEQPDFEAIMNGFEFTSPPQRTVARNDPFSVGMALGKIVFDVAVVAGIVWLIVRLFVRRRPRRPIR
jgi:hypothetical protein